MPNSEKYEELTGKNVCLEPEQEYRSYPNHFMREEPHRWAGRRRLEARRLPGQALPACWFRLLKPCVMVCAAERYQLL